VTALLVAAVAHVDKRGDIHLTGDGKLLITLVVLGFACMLFAIFLQAGGRR
jgi:hypothetical protein